MNITKIINSANTKLNRRILFMLVLAVVGCLIFMYSGLSGYGEKTVNYTIAIRKPRLYAMLLSAVCIGGSSVAFQSMVKNDIITPGLLGMGSLYTLIQTTVFFFLGATSIFIYNTNVWFLLNLTVMSFVALGVYGYLFKKTNYNILFVLLGGTVLSSFFGSLTTGMTRIMDPNSYDSLLDNLVASFGRVNSDILVISLVLIMGIIFVFRKEIGMLDVIALGKEQAINLGVDYDKSIKRVLLGVVLLMAITTALIGPLSFLGLIVVNLSRQLLKTYKNSYLIVSSILASVIILAFGQSLIEHILPFTTYISVVISIFGGTYFLFLIIKNKGA